MNIAATLAAVLHHEQRLPVAAGPAETAPVVALPLAALPAAVGTVHQELHAAAEEMEHIFDSSRARVAAALGRVRASRDEVERIATAIEAAADAQVTRFRALAQIAGADAAIAVDEVKKTEALLSPEATEKVRASLAELAVAQSPTAESA